VTVKRQMAGARGIGAGRRRDSPKVTFLDVEPSSVTSKSYICRPIFTPFDVMAASIYFVIDAVFLSILKPLSRRIARLPLFSAIGNWIGSFGPYATLALFVVPLVLLEPVKPVGVYLIASGHLVRGV
jgi:hypothetical protein